MKLIFLLGLITFSFPLLSNDSTFSPAERVWYFEGSDLPAIKMSFLKNGKVEFKTLDSKTAYSWLSPIEWTYSSEKKELTLSFPKAKSSDLANLKREEKKPAQGYENPHLVDLKMKKVLYRFPGRINFFGIIYEELNSGVK